MSGETASGEAGKAAEKKTVPHAEIAYGSVKRHGGSLELRITKGFQKSAGLGLKAGDDVLMLGVRGAGVVAVPAPKVVTGTSIPKVLDQIKEAIDLLRQSYDEEARQRTAAFLFDLALQPKPRIVIISPKKRKKKKGRKR